jgi:predicted nucleic acid-binding protein
MMRIADLAVPPDHAMLDSCVLLAATDENRKDHRDALTVLDAWPARGATLYLSGQILREYLSAATRPAAANGLGLTLADALENLSAFRDRATLLAESGLVADRLQSLLGEVACAGKVIHDANVIATVMAHGIHTVVTSNLVDFVRFERYVRLLSLLPGQSARAASRRGLPVGGGCQRPH